MKEVVEHKVGDVLTIGESIVVVTEGNVCEKCIFSKLDSNNISIGCTNKFEETGPCCGTIREDKANIIFAPVPEYEVGSIIYFRNRKLKVVESEDHTCNGCYFQFLPLCAEPETLIKTGLCSENDRKDHKDILFERLKM